MRKVFRPVARADNRIVRGIGKIPDSSVDWFMGQLSEAATKGKLWFGIAAVMAAKPISQRSAAGHGVLALSLASAVTNIFLKRLLPRRRPSAELLPRSRFAHPQPRSSSLPSGHAASAAAFVTGIATVQPLVGAALTPLAAAVAYSRVHTGAHWPSDVVLGCGIGIACGLAVRRWFPPHTVTASRKTSPVSLPALHGGDGLYLVANGGSGSYSETALDRLGDLLPEMQLSVLEKGQSVSEVYEDALQSSQKPIHAIGVWGGDGTVGAAANCAVAHGLPLAVFPGGTFNHFARDVHARNPQNIAAAIASGQALLSDVVEVKLEVKTDAATDRSGKSPIATRTRTMLNTGSVGIYPELVQRREKLQRTLGKTFGGIVAALRTFATAKPLNIEIDGQVRKIWLLFLGRGKYYPQGFVPLERPVVDDGIIDVRVISAQSTLSRLRIFAATLIGRTEYSPVVEVSEPRRITLSGAESSFDLAIDGEVIDNVQKAVFEVLPGALRVYSPQS